MFLPALLLQVTHKLSALLLKALQQPDTLLRVPLLAAEALNLWLSKASAAINAPPAPRAAAAVRQQLQELQLLQHLGPAMDAATAQLTAASAGLAEAAAAALAKATAATGSSGNTMEASTSEQATILIGHLTMYANAATCCEALLQVFQLAGCVLAPTGKVTLAFVVPAAPAAVRMVLGIFQALRARHQFQQQGLQPRTDPPEALQAVIVGMMTLTAACEGYDDVPSMLQSCPAASELMQMPELVSCLAIMAVATAMGVDTSSDMRIRTTSSSSGVGSSTGRKVPGAGRQQQQQQQPAPQAGCDSRSSGSGRHGPSSSGCTGACSSGSGDAGSRDSGLSNGVRLDSLTPMSCSLFDILGVSKETVVQYATLASSHGLTHVGFLHGSLKIYSSVLEYQVSVCRQVVCRENT
jgi:hypothetical protein